MSHDWLLQKVSAGQGKTLLIQQAAVCFQAGSITLVIGRNGAGKSTLLETMAGLRPLAGCEVLLGGEPLWLTGKRKPRLNSEVALRFGISLQSSESQWFAATVREELAYSLKPYRVDADEANRRSIEAMAEAGLSSDLLEREPWSLSGGQQRKLSLACLLACQPEWLLLDEPTAGLDTDGVDNLLRLLQAHRAEGKGAIIVTHDLDSLLPLADAIVQIDAGVVSAVPGGGLLGAEGSDVAALREGEEADSGPTAVRDAEEADSGPAALRDAEAVGGALTALREGAEEDAQSAASSAGSGSMTRLPEAHRALALLRAKAALPPDAPPADRGGAPWPAPRDLAAALATQLARRERAQEGCGARQIAPQKSRRAEQPAAKSDGSRSLHSAAKQAPGSVSPERYDPRMLLVAFLLLSTGIFAGNSLAALAVAAVAIVLLLLPYLRLLKPWLRLFRAYGLMLALFCLIGGIELSPLSFDGARALPIAIRFGKLLLAMLLAMPMLHLVTPMRLQRGLEQTFGWLARYKVPVHSFALLITLIFRFIPLLAAEWGRFSKLAHARGKASSPTGIIPLRMIVPLLIPYVRSILRMAEEMSDALEARGFSYVKQKPVYAFRLRFGPADFQLFMLAIGVTAGLWLASSFL